MTGWLLAIGRWLLAIDLRRIAQRLYVGLPGLDAVQYVQGENWLGVALAALMRIDREHVAWLGVEALRRLANAPLTEQNRFLLGECVESYLSLDEQQRQEYEQMIKSTTDTGLQAMNKTIADKAREETALRILI